MLPPDDLAGVWLDCVLVFLPHLINVAQPFADVFEALGVGDVIDQHDAHGSSVVRGGDGVEPFLPCCVPAQSRCFYLQIIFLGLVQPT